MHNDPQPPTTTKKTVCNHPKTPRTIYNHPQPPTTTQKLPPKNKTCHMQLFYCTLDVNTETEVDFDTDMKQWYIYMCVYVCIYFISHYIYYVFVRLIVCFCQYSKKFIDVQSDERCLF